MDLISAITSAGYLGIAAVIFAESGLLIGFFLPGDSLLFTAGFLASQGVFRIEVLVVVSVLAAISGDGVGYAIGHRIGPRLFTREDSFLFHRDHLVRARTFFERHGPKTIVLARFMPIIRTFVPMLAGVGEMRYATFLMYNIVGAGLWAAGLPLAGHWLGRVIPDVDRYLLPIILGIVVLSVAPTIVHVLRTPADRTRMISMIRRFFHRAPPYP